MKVQEIKELSVAELQERIAAAKAELQSVKINHAVSPVENTSSIQKARRDIARMLTVLGQKENVKS